MIRRAFKALLTRHFVTEVIGQAECPMMLRWSIWMPGPKEEPWFKVLIHYFPPNVSDRDPHDHPRSFWTLILKGRYFNTEWEDYGPGVEEVPTIECLSRGAVRFRPAEHMHIVETDDLGAWTLVVMGPMKREWGFLTRGIWIAWKPYIERFGGVVRCDTEEPPADYPQRSRYKSTPPPNAT